MAKYPDGISKMGDYLGCIVRLRHDLHRCDGEVLRAGELFRVGGHWRGRLRLDRPESPPGVNPVAIRQVLKSDVEIVAFKLA